MISFIADMLQDFWCRLTHSRYHETFFDDTECGYSYMYCHKCHEWRQL